MRDAGAAAAEVFGRAAEAYELGRPPWPEDGVALVVRELGLPSTADVLDLGAGTGKLTRLLAARFTRVVAVEPDDAMRRVLERVVPGAEAYQGTAETIPLEAGSVDAVFVAEAFHWFDGRRALAEISRVLRPGGGLVLLWNEDVRDVEPPMPAEAQRVIQDVFARGLAPGGPRYLSGAWRDAFEGAPFEALREAHMPNELEVERDALVANVLSISSIAALPADERVELGGRLRRLVPAGVYRRFLQLDAYWTRRTS